MVGDPRTFEGALTRESGEDQRYAEYLEYRRQLQGILESSSNSRDHWLIGLSGACLALTLSGVFGSPTAVAAFAVAVVSVLASFWLSEEMCRVAQSRLDDDYLGRRPYVYPRGFAVCIHSLNGFALGSFIGGLLVCLYGMGVRL